MTKNAIDLIKKLTEKDPKDRLSLQMALLHPFMEKRSESYPGCDSGVSMGNNTRGYSTTRTSTNRSHFSDRQSYDYIAEEPNVNHQNQDINYDYGYHHKYNDQYDDNVKLSPHYRDIISG